MSKNRLNLQRLQCIVIIFALQYLSRLNILIGMDILSLMETHIGLSSYNGKLILLACPYGQIVDSFNEAIEKHFGLRRVY